MNEYEQKLIELFNSTMLPNEAKMYVLYKHIRDVQDLVHAEHQKHEEAPKEDNEEDITTKGVI